MPSLITRESLRNEPLPHQYLHPYFEYNSTTKCSLISGCKSLRSGTALNTPSILSTSTSSHSAKPRCLASSRAACTRNCFFVVFVFVLLLLGFFCLFGLLFFFLFFL